MEKINTTSKRGIQFKFMALYLLSVAIIVFAMLLFWPRRTAATTATMATATTTNSTAEQSSVLRNIEALGTQYRALKVADAEYADKKAHVKGGDTLRSTDPGITAAENALTNTLDSLARSARAATDAKTALQLQQLIETFRQALADRSAMNAYKTAVLSAGDKSMAQQTILQLQTALNDKTRQMTLLEAEVQTWRNKGNATAANMVVKQQLEDLQTTIATQERKIAALTATNNVLEKEKAINTEATKATMDKTATALKNQNTALENKIEELHADLSMALVDCNISRADATKIISNTKQRKALLSEALGILNSFSSSSNAAVKNKVAERLARLNSVAATMHD